MDSSTAGLEETSVESPKPTFMDAAVASLFAAHTQRMQEISDKSLETSKVLLDDHTQTVRKLSGVRSAVLDQALKFLGLQPEEALPEEPQVTT